MCHSPEVKHPMSNVTYELLNGLIAEGERARQYAWDNYEALNRRETAYVLYGPDPILWVYWPPDMSPPPESGSCSGVPGPGDTCGTNSTGIAG